MPKHSKQQQKWIDVSCPVTGETIDISPRTAAKITGRSLPTVKKWADTGRVPALEMQVLRAEVLGLLPDPAWSRWRMRGGELISIDEQRGWQPYHLHAAWTAYGLVSELRQQVDALRARLTAATAALARLHTHTGPTPWQRRHAPEPAAVQLALPIIAPAPVHPFYRQKKARH